MMVEKMSRTYLCMARLPTRKENLANGLYTVLPAIKNKKIGVALAKLRFSNNN